MHTLLHGAALAAELICRRQRLSAASPFSCQQRVEERVDAGVPVSESRQDPVDCHLCADRDRPQHVGLIEWQQLPDPEGQETSPEGQDDAQDKEQHLGFGGPLGTAGGTAPAGPHRPGLGDPVEAAQRGVKSSDGQPGPQNAGTEENAHVGLGALLVPGRYAQLAFLVVAVLQVQRDHHWQAQRHRQAPGQTHTQQAGRARGRGGVQGSRHGPVAVQAHGSQSEDGGVHGEQVQAEKEAAAQLPKGPARSQAVVHNEGGSEKVEEVGQSEAQHLEVKRGGGRGGGGGGGSG